MDCHTPQGVEFAQLAARKGALKLELLGMKRRGRTMYAICKEAYGLRGSRQKVYEQVCQMVEDAIQARREEVGHG